MTTSTLPSLHESFPTGEVYDEAITTTTAEVFIFEVNVGSPFRLPNSAPIDDVVREFEADPEMAARIAHARKEIGAVWYADEPESLSSLRSNAGFSQAQLAAAANTTQPYIAILESGKNDPGTEMIAKLAAALGIDEARAFKAIRVQRKTRGQKQQ